MQLIAARRLSYENGSIHLIALDDMLSYKNDGLYVVVFSYQNVAYMTVSYFMFSEHRP